MKTPTDCTSLADVRAAIDHVDQQIVALISLRADYVRSAARFKSSEAEVVSADRVVSMMQARRAWAEREGLDPDFIEKLYRDLLSYFIEHEKKHLK